MPVILKRLAAPRCRSSSSAFVVSSVRCPTRVPVSLRRHVLRSCAGAGPSVVAGGDAAVSLACGCGLVGFGLRCGVAAAWARLSGASTMIMLRPSSLGTASTLAELSTCLGDPVEDLLPELGMVHLSATEHDR